VCQLHPAYNRPSGSMPDTAGRSRATKYSVLLSVRLELKLGSAASTAARTCTATVLSCSILDAFGLWRCATQTSVAGPRVLHVKMPLTGLQAVQQGWSDLGADAVRANQQIVAELLWAAAAATVLRLQREAPLLQVEVLHGNRSALSTTTAATAPPTLQQGATVYRRMPLVIPYIC
jgi:hypothetical protein